MSPAQVGAGMLETLDVAFYLFGFLAVFASLGGILELRLAKKWRLLKEKGLRR